ncbi:MAG: DUF4442 domain-containing protein [Deltaproteobacteria bacterium]|nr:DUF4442 domain-containing protein [Deltaproteobacteria bacterium]
MIPAALKATLFVRGLGLAKVPLLFLCQPVVEEIGDERCVVRIPLNFVTKNHLRSMYIGVLAIGADVTGGIMAVEQVRRAGRPVDVLFKDLKAEFLKRPTAAVRFTCADGQAIRAAVAVGIETGKRQNVPLHVSATVGDQEVARFDMTLTLKRRD